MFESEMLDRLSRVHPMVPLILFGPAIVVLFVVGARGEPTTLEAIGLVLAGYLFWTLTEYWMHRLVFHFEPEDGIGARLHWIIHGVHHDHPTTRCGWSCLPRSGCRWRSPSMACSCWCSAPPGRTASPPGSSPGT